MQLDPACEIAVRLMSINRRLNSDTLAFISGGEEVLVNVATQYASILDEIRKLRTVRDWLRDELDPIAWISQVASAIGSRVFVTRTMLTVADVVEHYLQEFGYDFIDGKSSDFFRSDALDEALLNGPEALVKHLKACFYHPDASLLTQNHVLSLRELGQTLVDEAEHVPFGSLAHAISRRNNVVITLCPMTQVGDGKAIRYQRITNDGHEEFIFYRPSLDTKSCLHQETRYAVAHELAHVALSHPPGAVGDVSREQEIEADSLATMFLHLHGAPVCRTTPSSSELDAIHEKTLLSESTRKLIMESISGDLGARRATSTSQGSHSLDDVRRVVRQYKNDQVFRSECEEFFSTTL